MGVGDRAQGVVVAPSDIGYPDYDDVPQRDAGAERDGGGYTRACPGCATAVVLLNYARGRVGGLWRDQKGGSRKGQKQRDCD